MRCYATALVLAAVATVTHGHPTQAAGTAGTAESERPTARGTEFATLLGGSSPDDSYGPPIGHPGPNGSNGTLYCPDGQRGDINEEHGDVTFENGGWTFRGDARVSSKASWNLLGGYIAFDMDVTGVAPEVNTNLYTSSTSQPNCGERCYCDIQKSPSGKPSCMEMDFVENNGRCAMATTIHTFATDGTPNNPNCDRWGCGSGLGLPSSGKFHVHAALDLDGTLLLTLDGQVNNNWNVAPSQQSNTVVVKTMGSIGAAIVSSQWFGWAPAEGQCPSGDKSGLAGSVFRVSNVRVQGTVVQGPEPSKC